MADEPEKNNDQPDSPPASFNQEDVNRMLAEERRRNDSKYKKSNQKLIDELSALKGRAALSASERKDLDDRIENLQSELMTKDELAKREKERLAKKYQKELNDAVNKSSYWQNQYTESTIAGDITGNSVKHNVLNPEHMVAILRPNTRLVEVVSEDGKSSGKYMTKVKLSDVDKDGKAVTLDLSVGDAIKRMREMPQHQNLFKGEGSGGLGSNTHTGQTRDASRLARENPDEYRRLRKAGKLKL